MDCTQSVGDNAPDTHFLCPVEVITTGRLKERAAGAQSGYERETEVRFALGVMHGCAGHRLMPTILTRDGVPAMARSESSISHPLRVYAQGETSVTSQRNGKVEVNDAGAMLPCEATVARAGSSFDNTVNDAFPYDLCDFAYGEILFYNQWDVLGLYQTQKIIPIHIPQSVPLTTKTPIHASCRVCDQR